MKCIKIISRLKISILFIFIVTRTSAQTDTLFWFAVPEVTSSQLGDVSMDRPVFLNFTNYGQQANVVIDQPARGGAPLLTFTIDANSSRSVDVTQWLEQMEVKPGNVILNYGIRIRASATVSVYYEVKNRLNPELFVLKGRNALGNQFFISSQNITNNSSGYNPLPYSSFSIVATEDNTTVTITPTANIIGRGANTPFTITMQRGQTYAAIATGQLPGQHLQGSTVVSSKPVAVTLSDDLLSGSPWGGCADLIGDQAIPVSLLGMEYIGVAGNLRAPGDKLYIAAVENGTNITKDGAALVTLNRGQSFETGIENVSTYLKANKPFYVFQLSGIGCELGAAMLPGILCTGSSEVSFYRSTTESLIINLLTKAENRGSFLVNGSAGIIQENMFSEVPGTNGVWYAAKVTLPLNSFPVGVAIRVSNTKGFFHLGVLQGGALSGTSFGYFSDFSTLSAKIIPDKTTFCSGESIYLRTDSVITVATKWKGPNGFIGNSHNVTITNVKESDKGFYYVYKTIPGCNEVFDSVYIDVADGEEVLFNEIVCIGNSFFGYSISGLYRDTFPRPGLCDSIRVLNLTVLPRTIATVNQAICEGQSFLGRMASGTYRDTLKTSTGCDSIRIVNLTVLPRKTFSISEIICEGQSFLGRSASGTYRDTLKAANGCDSVRILNLTVLPSKTFSISESICEGQSFLGRSASGTYRDTLKAGNGCDSIRILNLTVLPRKTFSISESICEGQSFLGRTTTGTYRDTLKAANGCDSIRILNLTVLPSKKFSITQTICEGQSFLGRTLSGTYRDTLKAADGCDSIRILNLTVTTIPRPNLGPDRSFCEGDSIQISPGIFPDYSWQNGATTANIWVRNSGLYWVRVSNGACIATDTLSIGALFPTPHNFLADTFRLCLGEPIEVPGYVRYRWSSGESAATYKVKQFGPLSLEVTTAEGCIGTDQTIIVSNNCKLVFIPNAFSPNGDGLNEVFRPKFGVPVTAYQCLIFNRWGQQIQLSTDPLKGWDGRWNGKYAPIGVYYYIIRFTDGAGERHERNGSVTLVR